MRYIQNLPVATTVVEIMAFTNPLQLQTIYLELLHVIDLWRLFVTIIRLHRRGRSESLYVYNPPRFNQVKTKRIGFQMYCYKLFKELRQ